MDQIEIIDRIMKVTNDWSVTLNLLEKYPIERPERIEPTPTLPLPEPPPQPAQVYVEEKVTQARKKFRIKQGTLRQQLLEALENFPNSTVEELMNLTGREENARSAISDQCKKLVDKKILVRSKSERGKYAYRLITAPH